MYLRGLTTTFPFTRRFRTFLFDGTEYHYFSHPYNWTWLNERCVEIPIAFQMLNQGNTRNMLEVGNVLSHYRNWLDHEILDRYETGSKRVLNCDARVFSTTRRYDLIVSLSTLEHVGWDEVPQDMNKAWETVLHLRSLLAPQGVFMFTIPAGYHPRLQQALLDSDRSLGQLHALKRVSLRNEWQECSPEEAASYAFGKPYPFANAVFICKFCSPLTE